MTAFDNNQGCIQTYTGKMYSVRKPDPAKVCIEDISIALGRTPRFGGHTRVPYTVVDHSYYVWKWVTTQTDSLDVQLAALLHDAQEAYLGDIPKPIKPLLVGFDVVEEVNQRAVAEAFGLDPDLFRHELVKKADAILLATEKRDVMGPCEQEWHMDLPEPWDRKVSQYQQDISEGRFEGVFHMLQFRRAKVVAA